MPFLGHSAEKKTMNIQKGDRLNVAFSIFKVKESAIFGNSIKAFLEKVFCFGTLKNFLTYFMIFNSAFGAFVCPDKISGRSVSRNLNCPKGENYITDPKNTEIGLSTAPESSTGINY